MKKPSTVNFVTGKEVNGVEKSSFQSSRWKSDQTWLSNAWQKWVLSGEESWPNLRGHSMGQTLFEIGEKANAYLTIYLSIQHLCQKFPFSLAFIENNFSLLEYSQNLSCEVSNKLHISYEKRFHFLERDYTIGFKRWELYRHEWQGWGMQHSIHPRMVASLTERWQ